MHTDAKVMGSGIHPRPISKMEYLSYSEGHCHQNANCDIREAHLSVRPFLYQLRDKPALFSAQLVARQGKAVPINVRLHRNVRIDEYTHGGLFIFHRVNFCCSTERLDTEKHTRH